MSSRQSTKVIKPLSEKVIQKEQKQSKQSKKLSQSNEIKSINQSNKPSNQSNKIVKQSKGQIRMKRDHASETAKSVSKYYSLRKKRSENYYDRIDENAKIFHGQTVYFEIPNDRRFAARTYETLDIHSAIQKLKSQKRIVRIIDHPEGNATRLLRQKKWEYPLDKNLKPGVHMYDFRNGQNEPYYTYIPSQNKEDYNNEDDDVLHRNERDDKRNKISQNDDGDSNDDSNGDDGNSNSDSSDNNSDNNENSGDDSESGLDISTRPKKRK